MLNHNEIIDKFPAVAAYAAKRYGRSVADRGSMRPLLSNEIRVSYSHGDTWTVWESAPGNAINHIGTFRERDID